LENIPTQSQCLFDDTIGATTWNILINHFFLGLSMFFTITGITGRAGRAPKKKLANRTKRMHIWCISSVGDVTMMKRTNIYLTVAQSKAFKEISEKTGYSMAEMIRRILDEWIEKQKEKK
jgi:ATP-dependent Zn protease